MISLDFWTTLILMYDRLFITGLLVPYEETVSYQFSYMALQALSIHKTSCLVLHDTALASG